ncbi:helix-turn-helix transcriptional regulator [Anaerotignum propionicum]|uniref:helix-turn-helix domain-containing protein n=1 Tax=Anaerotignum propionicum TaxID=28446 RepID=UPI00289C5B37|nr:helix-turn-helix transcriptional regulator [Anaerotignum propionicum]
MNFLDKLDSLMNKNGINKNILSKESGIPYTTIDGFYKKGYENVKLSTIKKLAEYFDTTLDYLMKDEITDMNYGKLSDFKFNQSEVSLIIKYRRLNESGKDMVNMVLEKEYERSKISNGNEEIASELTSLKESRLTPDDEKELELIRQEMLAEKRGRTSSASTTAKDAYSLETPFIYKRN